MIKRLNDVRDEIETICKRTDQRGDLTGFKCLDEIYSVKQGSFTVFLGAPAHGKSELIFEICMNQTERYGKRHLIYSPETGSAAEIMLELGHKYAGKPLYKTSYYGECCTEMERENALLWVNDNFLIEDADEDAKSFAELCEDLKKEEKDTKRPIHTIMAEPYNELKHDMATYGTRQDLYIESFMSDVRRFCKKENKHVFLSFHPGVQTMVVSKDKKFSYYPMPKAREAAGGQAALRKAMTWINLWRPHKNFKHENGTPGRDNELIVVVEKAKPKGVSFRGSASLFFKWEKNRYYEDINFEDKYAFEHEKIITPSTESNIVENPAAMETPVSQHREMLKYKLAADDYGDELPF